jgi:hypothetical protein
MAKTVSGVLLGFALVSLAVLLAGRGQAQATSGSGCKQRKVNAYRLGAEDESLPEGWEPFAITTSDRIAVRHCIKD